MVTLLAVIVNAYQVRPHRFLKTYEVYGGRYFDFGATFVLESLKTLNFLKPLMKVSNSALSAHSFFSAVQIHPKLNPSMLNALDRIGGLCYNFLNRSPK